MNSTPAKRAKELVDSGMSHRDVAKVLSVNHSTVTRDIAAVQSAPEIGASRTAEPLVTLPAREEKREAIIRKNEALAAVEIEAPRQRFSTIVMDPPWPMKKIERDVRPNQVEFDYPTMDERELMAFAATVSAMSDDDCHLFLWTTETVIPTRDP